MGIGLGQGHGAAAGIDAQHLAGPAQGGGGQRETAAITEHVQHAAVAEIGRRRLAVLPLVEIEARLLSAGQVDPIAQAAVGDGQQPLGHLAPAGPVGHVEPLGLGHVALGLERDALGPQQLQELREDQFPANRHGQGRELDH